MRRLSEYVKNNFWLMPSAIVLTAVCCALFLVEVDRNFALAPQKAPSFLLSAGADGAREVLATIAGSIITVAGVAFSITIVVLSLASSQYSPRVLRNFMSDWWSQAVLGGFLGIFAYNIIVLRTVRGEDHDPFIPQVSIMVSVCLALGSIGLIIYFIHHVAISIRASNIIRSIYEETRKAIDANFPVKLGFTDEELSSPQRTGSMDQSVSSSRTGYVQYIDYRSLESLTRMQPATIELKIRVGDFVGTDYAIASFRGGCDETMRKTICKAIELGTVRTLEQDVAFGLTQLVDVALKGLSPGINDTTTASIAVDHLGSLLLMLSKRKLVCAPLLEIQRDRFVPTQVTFGDFVVQAFSQIRQSAEGNLTILARMTAALRTIAQQTNAPDQLEALGREARLIEEAGHRSLPAYERQQLIDEARGLAALCRRKVDTNEERSC